MPHDAPPARRSPAAAGHAAPCSVHRRHLLVAAPGLAAPFVARAQAALDGYPDRPLRMLIPFPPGGGNDILARLLSDRLSERLGQRVIPENRTGSGGNVAAQALATARPDGYTIMLGTNGTQSMNQFVFKSMPYDTERDFANVCDIARIANVLAAAPGFPPRTVAELLDHMRRRPGEVLFGSSGVGTMAHLGMELISALTGAPRMVHVPYRGSAPMLVDLKANRVHVTIDNVQSSKPQVLAGEYFALGVTSPRRWFALPNVPAVSETIPGYEATSWQVVVAPALTPRPIVERLNRVLNDILAEPVVKRRLEDLGVQPIGGTPEDLDRFIRAETEKWRRIVAEAGIQPE